MSLKEFNEIESDLKKEIESAKNTRRLAALKNATDQMRFWKKSIAEMKAKIEEAKKGNWQPLVGQMEEDFEYE